MDASQSNNINNESERPSYIENNEEGGEGYYDEEGNYIRFAEGDLEEGEQQEGNEEEGEMYEEGEIDQDQEEDEMGGEGEDGGSEKENSKEMSDNNLSRKEGSDKSYSRATDQKSQEEKFERLPPERKIRFKLFRFVNQLRDSYMLPEFYQDLLGNRVAMEYAKQLIKDKDDENINSVANKFNFPGEFKFSSFVAYVDVSNDNGGKKGRYHDYASEFVDAHSTLVEFERDRENLLSNQFNTVSIGMAFDEEKVVIVDIFTLRELTIESCSINEETGSIVVKGNMLNDNYGVYGMRIVAEDNINKTLSLINPSQIISPEQHQRPFNASFNNAIALLQDESPKLIEVYIRERPSTIRYNVTFTDNMAKFEQDLKFLKVACRLPLESFPADIIIKEQKKEEEEEKKRLTDEETSRMDDKNKEREEKEYRIRKIDNEGLGFAKNFYKIGEVDPDLEEDVDENNSVKSKKLDDHSAQKYDNVSDKEVSDVSSEKSDDLSKKENYQKQLDKLEVNIEELKRENEELQRKIKILYDFRKKEGRDERNYYKESNINESTYADSLTSAANLHNELNTHKRKLMADLEKYNQSIEIQEERKREVYKILMNYKEELLSNSEYRKGSKIPKEQIETWLEKEKESEEEIRKLRIENIRNTLELNRLNKELKKMEEYFEGLHLIDFEQLKIENNTLTEKIEDRNEEIHKLKNKINNNVQILAHLQEKYSYINKEFKVHRGEEDKHKEELISKKDQLNKSKQDIEKNTLKKLQSKLKIDQINSNSLKKYYSITNSNIENLEQQIDKYIGDLSKFRGSYVKDIKLLESRKNKLMEEYKILPKFKDNQ